MKPKAWRKWVLVGLLIPIAWGSLELKWAFRKPKLRHSFRGNEPTIECLTFSPDGSLLACGGYSQIKLWDVATGSLVVTIPVPARDAFAIIPSLAFSPDGSILASGCDYSYEDRVKTIHEEGAIRLWELPAGRQLATFERSSRVSSLNFDPGGKRLASGSRDGLISVSDLASGKDAVGIRVPDSEVVFLSFGPDGKFIASATRFRKEGRSDQAGEVTLWELPGGKAVRSRPARNVHTAAFSPDGKTLAWSEESVIRVWDTQADRCIAIDHGHTIWATSLAFSPDGRILASGSGVFDWACEGSNMRGEIKLWDASDGRRRATLHGHPRTVRSVAFSPDGKTLASGSEDGTLNLWEMPPN